MRIVRLKLAAARRRLTRRMSNLNFFLLENHLRAAVLKFQVQIEAAPPPRRPDLGLSINQSGEKPSSLCFISATSAVIKEAWLDEDEDEDEDETLMELDGRPKST